MLLLPLALEYRFFLVRRYKKYAAATAPTRAMALTPIAAATGIDMELELELDLLVAGAGAVEDETLMFEDDALVVGELKFTAGVIDGLLLATVNGEEVLSEV
jgi:hypothetical protein